MSLLAKSPTSLEFTVHRREPELLKPAKPTPLEFKPLSDLESLDSFKIFVPGLCFYPPNPSKYGVDPVEVIRKAISEALVFYYPYAGRVREGPSGRLAVECTGEGVLFMEADTDVTSDQFGYPLAPPFPCLDQLLFYAPDSILNSPIMLIQVTRLKCGGFIFGVRYNHTISDAPGLVQFLSAIGEIARGATSPSILPIWERHVLCYKNQPQLTPERNKDITDDTNEPKMPLEVELCHRVYFFGPSEILALKRCVPPHLRNCSSYEIVTASIWKCRVLAFQPHLMEEMSLLWSINLRNKFKHLIRAGYYGNAVVFSLAKSTAKEIIENPLSYTLQVVRNAYEEMDIEDYIQRVANLKINNWTYGLTDLRYAGFDKVDFGWGEAEFGGPVHFSPILGNFFPFKSNNGEKGMMFPLCFPKQVMERFDKELNNILNDNSVVEVKSKL